MKKIISIPEDLCNYIEGLMYETNARKDVIAFMFNQPVMNEERFQQYHKEYLEFYAKYQMAKNNLQEQFIVKDFGNQAIRWNLNFQTNELEVEVKEE